MDLQNNVKAITLGIRFSRSFRILDISGEILDDILYSDSPFENKYETIEENSNKDKFLRAGNKDEYLRINTDDIIINTLVDNNLQSRYDWLKNKIIPYLKNNLFLKHKIKNIIRIGIVFHHEFARFKELNNVILTLTNDRIKETNNIKLSFTEKQIVPESLYRKGFSDYKNIIYTFDQKESNIVASLDFQYYNNPIIEDLRDSFIDKITADALIFLKNNYYEWIKSYV